MSGRHRVVLALCLALGAIMVMALWQPGPRRREPPVANSETVHTDPRTGEQYRIVGGVRRSLKEVGDGQPKAGDKARDQPSFGSLIGVNPTIPTDANPMVKSVFEAAQSGTHPERLSVLLEPKPFDRAAYQADPQAYLNVVEPGRVFQPAQPGEGVSRLKPLSPPTIRVPQKETIALKVKAIPQAPVTFTSFDLGVFQNQLTSITVAAGDDGVAIARFTGTPGTYDTVSILAASPMTSGQVKFVVDVIVAGFNDTATLAGKTTPESR